MPKAATRKKQGYFITFEGGEGAGKSSQIHLLEKQLKSNAVEFIVTREPGGSPGAEAVRHVLLSGAAEHLGPEMEAMLFSAARSDHVETVIRPALQKGKIVICDRFYDSTRVYQGMTGGVDLQFLFELENVACEDAKPNLTIILDVDPKLGLARVQKRLKDSEEPDRFEKDKLDLHNSRRNGFLAIAKREPQRCVVVDGNRDQNSVFEDVWSIIEARLMLEGLIGNAPAKKPATRRRKATAKVATS